MAMASEIAEEENEEELWDCVCGDGEIVTFDVTKVADFSGYFSAMLHSEMRETIEKQISLDLITSETLVRLLNLFNVYEEPIKTEEEALTLFAGDLSLDHIEEFLEAVDYLDISCLYPRVGDVLVILVPKLCSCLSVIWRFWENSCNFGLKAVKTTLYSHLAKNLSQLTSVDYFFIRELPMELIVGTLSLPDIPIKNEVDVMRMIKDWVMYCPGVRRKELAKLMCCVHIPSLLHCDLKEIEGILEELDEKEENVTKAYSSYLANPHTFFATRSHQSDIRNGQDVLMLFSGMYPGRLNTGAPTRGRTRMNRSLPLMYENVAMIRRQCTDAGLPQPKPEPDPPSPKGKGKSPKGKGKGKGKRKSSSPKSKVDLDQEDTKSVTKETDTGLCPKTLTKIKAPEVLMEFGICLHENFVYMAGGQHRPTDDAYPVDVVYRMDCHLGEWADVSPMRERRCLFYLCSVWGRIYAVGGANTDGILRQVEYYEPTEDRWYEGPCLRHEVHEHAGCVYKNKIYICGGHDDAEHTDQMLVLDGPGEETQWRPLAPMLQRRSYHALAPVGDHLYVFGGCQSSEEIKDLYSVEQYNPRTDMWTKVMNLNVPINESLPIIIDDEVLFMGSYSYEMKESLQQTVSVNVRTRKWKIAPIEFAKGKKVVGYKCVRLKVKKRLVK